jgi:hypothetical protein
MPWRENAFQLDSWDNVAAIRSADSLQATAKIIWERQTEVYLGGGFEVSILDGLEGVDGDVPLRDVVPQLRLPLTFQQSHILPHPPPSGPNKRIRA